VLATLMLSFGLRRERFSFTFFSFIFMYRLLLFASGLALGSLTGCKDDAPEVSCYSGVVIGTTCMDGTLIEVNSATPIGKPINVSVTSTTSIVGTNVVAAVNDLGSQATMGQTIFFTYQNSPNNAGPARPCPQNTIPLPIPRLILSNVSATGCGKF
jgi:hypothetical protein